MFRILRAYEVAWDLGPTSCMHGDSEMLPHLDTEGFPSSKPELETLGYGDNFGFYVLLSRVR